MREIDRALEARIRFAKERGDLRDDAKPDALTKMVAALLSSLSIRSRAGVPRAELDAIIDAGLELICGAAKPARGTKSRRVGRRDAAIR